MVEVNPDQLFTMIGRLQAELMVLRETTVAQETTIKQLETKLAPKKAKKGD